MKNYNEEECKKFYKTAKSRISKGNSEEAIFASKPEGFSEWLKNTWPRRKNILRLKNDKFSLVKVYRIYSKKYGGIKCPTVGVDNELV